MTRSFSSCTWFAAFSSLIARSKARSIRLSEASQKRLTRVWMSLNVLKARNALYSRLQWKSTHMNSLNTRSSAWNFCRLAWSVKVRSLSIVKMKWACSSATRSTVTATMNYQNEATVMLSCPRKKAVMSHRMEAKSAYSAL